MNPWLFIHGWGQSREVWHSQMDAFPQATFINLPGHGGADEQSLEQWSNAVPESGEPAILIGWSLGGILAMQMALQQPERVRALVLVATTPCFCLRDDWPHACSREVFADFEQALAVQSPTFLGRFFALMLHGDRITRRQYQQLARTSINRRQPPTMPALAKGLEILKHTDLRPQLDAIRCPVLMMHGRQDVIVPFAAAAWLQQQLPQAELRAFDPCGHAPFLTHSNTFNHDLEDWCLNI